MKSLPAKLLPPLLTAAWRQRAAREPVAFAGDHASWADALRLSGGYLTLSFHARLVKDSVIAHL